MKEHIKSWGKVCGICIDGSRAILGCPSGFQHLVLNKSPKVIGAHYMANISNEDTATRVTRSNQKSSKFYQFCTGKYFKQ